MNDIRRTILWVVFGMAMVLLWDKWQVHNGQKPTFFPDPTAVAAKSTAPAAAPAVSAPTAANASQANSGVPSSTVAVSKDSAAAATGVPIAGNNGAAAVAKELITITTDLYKLGFDAEGGSLVRAELLKQRDIVNKDINMVLLDASKERLYNAQTGLIGAAGLPNHKTPMTLVSTERVMKEGVDTLAVRFEAASGDVKLVKTYTFKRGSYAIGVTHEVTNTSNADIAPQLYVQLIRDGNKPAGESSFYSTFTGPVVYSDAKKYQKVEFSDIEKNKADFEKSSAAGYVGMVQHYFFSAWLAQGAAVHENFVRKVDTNLYAAGMILPMKTIAAGGTQKVDTQLYVGPQEEKRLEAIAPGLELVKDYGYFTILSKPLFWLIDWLHKYLANWGWAIVAVVVLLKIAFYWLNAKAYQSMGKMKAINPKIMEMRERLKDNPQQMQQEMMKIYREEKVNPLGGCFPILIQIPVFIALYWVLLSSVEFRGAPWILWIKDLSVPDALFGTIKLMGAEMPIGLLPILMTLSSLLQTWLNPTPPDPMQAKMMWIMPLMFSFMFFYFPAGLVLYWLVNNILSIAQQWVINKRLGVN